MKLEHQPTRIGKVRSREAVGTLERPDASFDLRQRFPRLLEDHLQRLLENIVADDLTSEETAVRYAYLLSLADYFGRPLPFLEPSAQQTLEDEVLTALRVSLDSDLRTERNPLIGSMEVGRAFAQVFPGQQNREGDFDDALFTEAMIPDDPKLWCDSGVFGVDTEMVIEWVTTRPDLRATVEALITDEAVFQEIWSKRHQVAQKEGWSTTLEGLADIVLVWPKAREVFQFPPQELEKVVRQELSERSGDLSHLHLLWAVAVLTASQGWIDEQGKIHLRPPVELLADQSRSLPPRDLVS